MSNALFASGRDSFLLGDTDWLNDTFRTVLVDHADDTPVPASDDFLSDIAAPARVGTSGNMTTYAPGGDGTADADDVTFTALSGDPFESIVVYKWTGSASSSQLIVFYDTTSPVLPIAPNGGDIVIQWAATQPYLFRL